MNTVLQQTAREYAASGWTITSMTDDLFLASRPTGTPAWAIVLAILLFPIGLLFLLVKGPVQSVMVTGADAENRTRVRQEQQAANEIAALRRATELAQMPALLRLWANIPFSVKIVALVGLIVGATILCCVGSVWYVDTLPPVAP